RTLIEFFGRSSVGKTTCGEKLSEEVGKGRTVDNYISKQKLIKKIRLILRLTLTHPFVTFKAIKVVVFSKQNSLSDFIINVYNLLYVISVFKNKTQYVTIMDQGLFQSIISINLSANKDITEQIKSLLDKIIKKPLIVVRVESSLGLIRKRILNRSDNFSRVENGKSIKLEKVEEAYNLVNNIFLKELINSDNNYIQVISIDNEYVTLEENIEKIKQSLFSLGV